MPIYAPPPMLAKRLISAAAAVLLVIGAFALRSRIDHQSSPTPSGSTTTTTPAGTQIVCVTELAEACKAAVPGATIEAAGDTIDRLTKADDPGRALWVTLAPLPDMVDTSREAGGRAKLFASSTPVASSKLVLVGRTPQMNVLEAHCGPEALWKCLGSVAGQPWTKLGGQAAWGTVKPAHQSPDSDASGLLTFANAVVGWFGQQDIATVDLDDDEFNAWVTQLERSIPYFGGPQGTPFDQLLLLPSVNVVGTYEAEVRADAGSHRSGLTVAYPSPMARADVVLAGAAGTAVPPGLVARLTAQLGSRGWDGPSTDDVSPSGLVDGLSPAALLPALRSLWLDVVR